MRVACLWGDARVNIVSLCQIHIDHHEFMNRSGAFWFTLKPSLRLLLLAKTKAKFSAVATDSLSDDFTAWLK